MYIANHLEFVEIKKNDPKHFNPNYVSLSERGFPKLPPSVISNVNVTGVGNRQIHSDSIEIYNILCICADINTSMYQNLLNFMKDSPRNNTCR